MIPIYSSNFGITKENPEDERFLGPLRRSGLGDSSVEKVPIEAAADGPCINCSRHSRKKSKKGSTKEYNSLSDQPKSHGQHNKVTRIVALYSSKHSGELLECSSDAEEVIATQLEGGTCLAVGFNHNEEVCVSVHEGLERPAQEQLFKSNHETGHFFYRSSLLGTASEVSSIIKGTVVLG